MSFVKKKGRRKGGYRSKDRERIPPPEVFNLILTAIRAEKRKKGKE